MLNGQYQREFAYQAMAFRGDDAARNHAEQLSMLANARRRTDHGIALARFQHLDSAVQCTRADQARIGTRAERIAGPSCFGRRSPSLFTKAM